MEKIELEIKERFYLDYILTDAGSLLYGTYRGFESSQFKCVNLLDKIEEIVVSNNRFDPFILALFDNNEHIKSVEVIHEKYVELPQQTTPNIYTERFWDKSPWSGLDDFVGNEKRISIVKLIYLKEDLLNRFKGDQRIIDLHAGLLELREIKKKQDEENLSNAEYNRDYNQYMTWKTLEGVKQTGRFDKFLEKETK